MEFRILGPLEVAGDDGRRLDLARLTLSERTVENHVSRILHKLMLDSRTALAVWHRSRRTG